MKERWAVFISGRGSNLSSILSSPAYAKHPVKLVVSSKKNCEGVFKARRAGIPVHYMPKSEWAEVQTQLEKYRIQRIFLAGFMRILPRDFVERWQGRVLNVHPSLLPAYPGLKSIERAYEERSEIGVTVHQVIVDVDRGENVLQRRVWRTEELPPSLAAVEFRMHCQEHRLVRRSIEKWLQKWSAGA